MHKQFKYVGLFLAFSLNNALATESVDVRVIGAIAPSACVIMLTGGGVVDYGAIKPETLSEDDFNVLAGKKLDLSINCAAPTMVALKSVNSRPTKQTGQVSASGEEVVSKLPFVKASNIPFIMQDDEGGEEIGGYTLSLSDSLVDGEKATLLMHNIGDSTWHANESKTIVNNNTELLTTWGAKNTTMPKAFEMLSATLNIQSYLNKGSALDSTRPIILDGMSTLELYYL